MGWYSAFIDWVVSLFTHNQDPNNEKVTAIQAAAVKTCGFLPMYDSVIALLATGFPPAAQVSTIANAICHAVNSQNPVATLVGTTQQTQTVIVNGVEVTGTRV